MMLGPVPKLSPSPQVKVLVPTPVTVTPDDGTGFTKTPDDVPSIGMSARAIPESGSRLKTGLTHHFFRAYAPLFPAFLRVFHGN